MSLVTTRTASPGIGTNTIVESTTDAGVEIKRVTTELSTVVTPGMALTAAAFQIVSRVTIESNFDPFYFVNGFTLATERILSTMLNSRKTTTEELSGVPCATGVGYAWVQGGQFTESFARLRTVEVLDEWFTWNADCSPRTSIAERRRWYSPLALSGSSYPDGTIRANAAYVWYDGKVWRGGGDSNPYIWLSLGTGLWVDLTEWPTDWYSTSWGALYRAPGAAVLPLEAQGVGRLTSYRLFQATAGVETFGVLAAGAAEAAISPLAQTMQPASGSASIPQVFEEVLLAETDATEASGYPRRTEAPALLPYPETVGELNTIAARRLRRAFSDTLDITHNAIPFLRVGDHVSITNHARSLIAADAYVVAIKRTADVLNGAMRQVTTVKIPPSWI